MLTSCIILQAIIEIFQMVTEIKARNEVYLLIRGYSTLICSIVLPSTIRIFLVVAELHSRIKCGKCLDQET